MDEDELKDVIYTLLSCIALTVGNLRKIKLKEKTIYCVSFVRCEYGYIAAAFSACLAGIILSHSISV